MSEPHMIPCPDCNKLAYDGDPDKPCRTCGGAAMVDANERRDDLLAGLPPDLVRVLRDPSIVVKQDQAVFELIASWQNAKSDTPSSLHDFQQNVEKCASWDAKSCDCLTLPQCRQAEADNADRVDQPPIDNLNRVACDNSFNGNVTQKLETEADREDVAGE